MEAEVKSASRLTPRGPNSGTTTRRSRRWIETNNRCCQHCGHLGWIERLLLSELEEPGSTLSSRCVCLSSNDDCSRLPTIDAGLGSESRPLPNQERTMLLRYRVFVATIQQSSEAPRGPAAIAEAIRVQRLRDDARRPMSINLAEGIALSHKLMQFVGAARHSD